MEPQPVPPLSAFQGHSNEEASQAGLGARRARSLRRPPADKDPRRTAINPFNNVEIIDLPASRAGLPAGMRGAYGAPRVIPAGYAVKPPHPFVMTARLPFTGCGRWDVTGMPRRSTLTLSGRAVDALAVSARDVIVWDRELAGFGVRVYPSGRKVYVVQSRAGGAPRRVTLGTHGEITATQARKRAAQVIDRIKRGEEPGPLLPQAGTTVADLAERYMSAHVAQNCNAHTAGIYRGSLENHILPALGMMPLGLVERAHVSALHYRLRETPRAANRALAVLSKMFSLAAAWGLVPDGTNPCRAVRKYKERKRERFLSREEYRRLGQALAEAEAEAGMEGAVSPYAIAALRLLMLTGCRLNEILTLRWDDVDRTAGEFRLRDGKTGTRMVPLTPTAEARAGRHPPHAHQPLGHRRQAAGLPISPPSPPSGTASAPAPASTTSASTTSATATQAARSPPARASP